VALKALQVSAIPPPWIHPDTTTIALYGAYPGDAEPSAQGAQESEGPVAPRPAYGQSQDGRNALQQVLRRLGVSGDGGLPLRLGIRDGTTSDRPEQPGASEACRP
jgi:hypothetical protein